jgi:hypothetical protein
MTTDIPSLNTLQLRLAKLEHQNRRMKQMGIAILIMVTAILMMGQIRNTSTLTARRIVLNDAGGVPRLVLYMKVDGEPSMALYDRMGNMRAELSLQPGGYPRLSYLDPGGKIRSVLGVQSDGGPALILADGNQVPRAEMSVRPDGSSGVVLYGLEGKASAELVQNTLSMMRFYDPAARLRLLVGMAQNQPKFHIQDTDGLIRYGLSEGADGTPTTRIVDRKGQLVWQAPPK